jgi:transglutaminase-like putative cysteine protease
VPAKGSPHAGRVKNRASTHSDYVDNFGNICHVIRSPAGNVTISSDFLIEDSGEPDAIAPEAKQHALEALPVDSLIYLLGSRYCETDRLSDFAWSKFAKVPKGWTLVRTICDFVHEHLTFGYPHARPTKTAYEAFEEGRGVCRDFAHLAITLCRCMNIPARYCTGYLGDIGVPPEDEPMDFSAWLEVYLGDRWLRSTRDTTCLASAGSSWRADATQRTSPSRRLSVPAILPDLRS